MYSLKLLLSQMVLPVRITAGPAWETCFSDICYKHGWQLFGGCICFHKLVFKPVCEKAISSVFHKYIKQSSTFKCVRGRCLKCVPAPLHPGFIYFIIIYKFFSHFTRTVFTLTFPSCLAHFSLQYIFLSFLLSWWSWFAAGRDMPAFIFYLQASMISPVDRAYKCKMALGRNSKDTAF